MPSLNTGNAILSNALKVDSSYNVGIGGAASGSFKLQVTGATNLTGVLTLGSTISNGTFTYTLPSATGTLALTSALSGYLPLTGGTLTGALSGTTASFNSGGTSNAGFFQINDGTTTLGNSFTTVHRNSNDGNGRFSLTRWQVQNTSGLEQSAFIGAQAVTGASNYSPNLILGVSTGVSTYSTYLTIASTGAATFSSSVTATGANLSGNIVLNRPSTSAGNNIEWRTANTLNWYIGTRGLVDNNFYFVNEGLGSNNLILNASTGAATFSSSVTAVGLSSTTSASGNLNSLIRNNVTSASGTTGYALTVRNLAGSSTYFHISTETGRVGNVGIGTTEPSETLQVNGSVRALQTNSTGIAQFAADASNTTSLRCGLATFSSSAVGDLLGVARAANSFLYKNGGALAVGTGAAHPLIFSTSDTERMRITNNGNVLIGITSDFAFQGGALLRVNREQNTGTNIQINNQAANANAAAHVIFSTNGNGWVVGMGSQQSSSGNTFYFSPDPTGALNKVATLTTGGVWSTTGGGTSDLRTKQDIDYNFDNGIESILKLQPTKFKFKTAPDKQRRGFIAQDVLEVIPDLVLGDGEKENGTYGLDYDGILALAVKAVQELNQKVNDQQQTINSLINR
jgi:hypothetical protein